MKATDRKRMTRQYIAQLVKLDKQRDAIDDARLECQKAAVACAPLQPGDRVVIPREAYAYCGKVGEVTDVFLREAAYTGKWEWRISAQPLRKDGQRMRGRSGWGIPV